MSACCWGVYGFVVGCLCSGWWVSGCLVASYLAVLGGSLLFFVWSELVSHNTAAAKRAAAGLHQWIQSRQRLCRSNKEDTAAQVLLVS
jgi:hypothetical protein